MALLEKALDYIVGIITENEAVKKFPKDFVTASAQWIRSWFLVDDPKIAAKLADPEHSTESKRTIIEVKLEDLQDNPAFMQELVERLVTVNQHKPRIKNVVRNADLYVHGNAHIGEKGSSLDNSYDEKNIIDGGTFKVGGDFRLGDEDLVAGNQNVQIVHNLISEDKGKVPLPSPSAELRSELKSLLGTGKTKEVIDRLLSLSESRDGDLNNQVWLQLTRFTELNNQEHKNVISNTEAGIERNKINDALVRLIDELGK